MAKGDGTIIEKARGVFEVQVSLGRDPITGRYLRKSRTVHGSKADARKMRDQIRSELEQGIRADGDKVTLRAFCDEFIRNKRTSGKASQNTIDRDKARLDFICEILGDISLRDINVRVIEFLYKEIRERRTAQGWGCGNTTLRTYHVILKAVLKKAVDYDLILRNPCDRVDAPSVDKVHRKSLTVEEASDFLKKIDQEEDEAISYLIAKEQRQSDWGVSNKRDYLLGMANVSYLLAVRLGFASGMRLGEVLALQWGSVNFDACTISIIQSLDNKSKPKAPKTEAGHRTIAIDATTIKHLKRWHDLQIELLDTLCIDVGDLSPVLCSATGDYLNKDNFGRWWRTFRKSIGFEDLKFHELRHTQATQLLANGVDIKTVQNRLGHAKASITMDFYAHAVPENDEKAAQLIGNLFRQETNRAKIIKMPQSA